MVLWPLPYPKTRAQGRKGASARGHFVKHSSTMMVSPWRLGGLNASPSKSSPRQWSAVRRSVCEMMASTWGCHDGSGWTGLTCQEMAHAWQDMGRSPITPCTSTRHISNALQLVNLQSPPIPSESMGRSPINPHQSTSIPINPQRTSMFDKTSFKALCNISRYPCCEQMKATACISPSNCFSSRD